MDGFSFPFRFVNQRALKISTSSDAYKAQLIAAAIYTQIGELPLTPDFGSRIAAFSSLDMGDFLVTLASYVQDVSITSIEQTMNSDQTVSLSIQYKVNEG